MQLIKKENGWSLFADSQPIQYQMYMVRFFTKFDQSRHPDELREVGKFFLSRDELELLAATISAPINSTAA